MFPWSVIPSAVWPSATAASTSSPTRAAPSSIENSVWTCRWVNPLLIGWRRSQVGAVPGVRDHLGFDWFRSLLEIFGHRPGLYAHPHPPGVPPSGAIGHGPETPLR